MSEIKKPIEYRVSAPVTTFDGEVGDMRFRDGVYDGPVSDGALAYFDTAGYSVEVLDEVRAREAGDSDEAAQAELAAALEVEARAEQLLTERLPDAVDAEIKRREDEKAETDRVAALEKAKADREKAAADKKATADKAKAEKAQADAAGQNGDPK